MNTKTVTVLVLTLAIQILSAQNWQYLGQTPPDSVPVRFGSAYLHSNSEWTWYGSPEFSPDGKELFFTRYYFSDDVKLFCLKYENENWTPPYIPDFAGTIKTGSPVFFGNNRLYLVRDVSNNNNFRIYTTERTSAGWNTPQLVTMPYNNSLGSLSNISIANNQTIYFTLHTAQGAYLYRSVFVNNQYSQFEKLPNQINSFNSSSPYIDPEERYIIFESDRTGGYGASDLYVSFKDPQNNWSVPINLGNSINSPEYDCDASITPDGKYLFYISKRSGDINSNAYWVDTGIISRLNPYTDISQEANHQPATPALFQNYPNPFNPTTTIKFSLPKKQYAAISIFNVKGELVAELGKKVYSAGLHTVEFYSNNLNSGQYFYQLKAGDVVTTKKMMVVK